MAVEDFSLVQRAGKTIYFVIWRLTDGLAWDSSDDTFKAIGSAVAPYISSIAEAAMGGRGFSVYRFFQELDDVNSGPADDFQFMGYTRMGLLPDLAVDPPAGYLAICIEDGRTKLTAERVEEIVEGITGCTGTGDCLVDQDYPTDGNLCYISSEGIPIDNADVRAYLKDDYCAGRRGNEYVKGYTTTTMDGSWRNPLMLDSGLYIIEFRKQGVSGPDIVEILVDCD
jgi:hypothetical protein